MNSYEEKQAAKKARLEERAESAQAEAAATYARARQMAEVIPFGQPILVGHHSEGRDRKYRAKIHNTFGKSFALAEKSEHYARKAAAVGTGGISSDDPEATQKLRVELQHLRTSQETMKKANAVIRKYKGDEESQIKGIIALGYFTEQQANDLIKPDFAGRIGFASYALTNNNANIRRIEQRIKELETMRQRPEVEQAGQGYIYREDTTENRVMFIFEGKPDEDTRKLLKGNAFKWSPSRNAWVRQLTNAGIWAGKQVRAALDQK